MGHPSTLHCREPRCILTNSLGGCQFRVEREREGNGDQGGDILKVGLEHRWLVIAVSFSLPRAMPQPIIPLVGVLVERMILKRLVITIQRRRRHVGPICRSRLSIGVMLRSNLIVITGVRGKGGKGQLMQVSFDMAHHLVPAHLNHPKTEWAFFVVPFRVDFVLSLEMSNPVALCLV